MVGLQAGYDFATNNISYRDAPGVEEEQPGEKDKIYEVAAQFNRFQMMNFNEHHHCLRGTHLKTQGVCFAGHSYPSRALY